MVHVVHVTSSLGACQWYRYAPVDNFMTRTKCDNTYPTGVYDALQHVFRSYQATYQATLHHTSQVNHAPSTFAAHVRRDNMAYILGIV